MITAKQAPSMIDVQKLKVDVRRADNNKILSVLTNIFLQGVAAGANAEIDDSFRFLRIKKEASYQCLCPECKTWLELDLEDLLNEEK